MNLEKFSSSAKHNVSTMVPFLETVVHQPIFAKSNDPHDDVREALTELPGMIETVFLHLALNASRNAITRNVLYREMIMKMCKQAEIRSSESSLKIDNQKLIYTHISGCAISFDTVTESYIADSKLDYSFYSVYLERLRELREVLVKQYNKFADSRTILPNYICRIWILLGLNPVALLGRTNLSFKDLKSCVPDHPLITTLDDNTYTVGTTFYEIVSNYRYLSRVKYTVNIKDRGGNVVAIHDIDDYVLSFSAEEYDLGDLFNQNSQLYRPDRCLIVKYDNVTYMLETNDYLFPFELEVAKKRVYEMLGRDSQVPREVVIDINDHPYLFKLRNVRY